MSFAMRLRPLSWDATTTPVNRKQQCLLLQDRMIKWLAMPLPPQRMRPVITALTSTFSHAGLAHLGINMMALRIFGSKLSTVIWLFIDEMRMLALQPSESIHPDYGSIECA